MDIFQKFPEEIEEGNIEYKRQISNDILRIPEKLVKFKTQLLWRLDEGKQLTGKYEAIYYIGIEDDGNLSNQSIDELNQSIKNFIKIVKLCGASMYSTQIDQKYLYAKLTIQKLDDYISGNEITIALLGASDSGKSTFLGTLTYDIKDDGNGLARSNILRHDHEKQNGITSSIKHEIVGHDNDNKYINYNSNFIYSWEYIIKNSNKIINFIDLPGNFKYIKTTLFGLTAHRPDHVFIFVSLLDMDNPITKLHINLCEKLEINYTKIYTKKDISNINMQNAISNITGEGIHTIKNLIRDINPNKVLKEEINKTTEFIINDIIVIPDMGTVLIGYVNEGKIKIGNKLMIGPYNNSFYTVEIMSIHKKQIPCKYLYQNETGTIIINSEANINISKHMMLITSDHLINFKTIFKILLKDKNELKEGSKLMSFCRNIYDIVTIIKIIDDTIILSYSTIQYIKKNEFIVLRNNNEFYVGIILE
ncbi:GTP binding translation elongation factor [Indivirus ILV1]|uniref:GTP binding translation elongation factor n=1 Tax=Indivirus ILV1 TaxID=1977633 RepID=A0A1V0SD61_9VIRU|nr:GTP binding translation elongation factor [Indivirus ILV1]